MKPIDSLIMLFAVLSLIRRNKENPEVHKGVRLYHTRDMRPISTEEFMDWTLGMLLTAIDHQAVSFEQIGLEEPKPNVT